MPGYGWGAASLAHLGTCDPLLILLFQRAIKRADLRRDMKVVYGYRGKADQDALVAKGASKLRWPNSRHNTTPAQAVDVVPLFGGKVSYDWPDYHAIAPSIKAEWAEMVAEGLVPAGVTLEWGGDWKRFPDGAHWQINGVR